MYRIIIILVFVIYLYRNRNKYENMSNARVATELDDKRATKHALKNFCLNKGYKWNEYDDEFMYDCVYTKEKCLKESIYPTNDNQPLMYFEWRESNTEDAKSIQKSSIQLLSSNAGNNSRNNVTGKIDGGVCIAGTEEFRKFCQSEKLRYDPSTGKCLTTKQYCLPKLMAYCNEDCFEPPGAMVLSKVVGTTIGRALGTIMPADLITRLACN